jgi:Transmembrane secretion effector
VTGAAGAQHRFGGLLWERNFRLLWTGETVSGLGNSMAVVGVPLLAVSELHAGPFAVAALTAAAYFPWLVIGLLAGAWVDRLRLRGLMIACDVVSVVMYASVPWPPGSARSASVSCWLSRQSRGRPASSLVLRIRLTCQS